jgi:hypothetical protein
VVKDLSTNAPKAMFVQLLVEGANPSSPTTKANLDAWIGSRRIPFTTGMDAVAGSREIKSVLGPKETSYIIDRASLKILVKTTTTDDALVELAALPL